MTELENELQSYIKEMLSERKNDMSGTTFLLIKEIGIPILIEYLKRKDKEKAAKLVEEISKDPKNIDNLPKEMKRDLIGELTDVISDLLDGLVGKKV